MSVPVVVIGFGGHGRVVTAALQACGRKVVAATDMVPRECHDQTFGVEVITDEMLLERYTPNDVAIAVGLGSISPISESCPRRRVVERFTDSGYQFTGFVHPTAWVSSGVEVAPTAQVHAGAIVQPGTQIGEHVILNTRSSVDHDCRIGDYCHVGPGVTISGDVSVGPGSHLGTGATLIQGLNLGEECFVAAGAVVVAGVSDNQFVKGVPARPYSTGKP